MDHVPYCKSGEPLPAVCPECGATENDQCMVDRPNKTLIGVSESEALTLRENSRLRKVIFEIAEDCDGADLNSPQSMRMRIRSVARLARSALERTP